MAIAFSGQETPAGTIDGINPLFTLMNAPSPASSLMLVRGGLAQQQGVDFALVGSTITFLAGSLPLPGDPLVAWYQYSGISSPNVVFSGQETPAGTIDGANAAFTLVNAPSPALSLMLARNGLALTQGLDYTLAGSAITFLAGSLPMVGDSLAAWYQIGGTFDPTILFSGQETPGRTIDGVNAVFTLANFVSPASSLMLARNGLLQQQGVDFDLSGTTVTFRAGAVPSVGDSLIAWYQFSSGVSIIIGAGPTIDYLLRSAFRCINQLRPGFGHSNSERIDALFILNAMLDGWATDDLNCFCELIQSFPLTGRKSYTIGPGGDFDAARPVKVNKATLVILTNPAQPSRKDLTALNAEQFQQIGLQSIASTIPQRYYYETSFPLGRVHLWTLDQGIANLELSSSQALAGGFTDGTATFSAPPGYLDAVRYNLAVRLAMEFNQPLKPGVQALADESLAKIQRLNDVTPQMQCDAGILSIGSRRGSFNWLTGD